MDGGGGELLGGDGGGRDPGETHASGKVREVQSNMA